MRDRLLCLDASVVVKYLTAEAGHPEAAELIRSALESDAILVAPSWAWAEVGSTLRKKSRTKHLTRHEAQLSWSRFLRLPIEFIDDDVLRRRSWEIADEFGLPSMYDAAYLACTETAYAGPDPTRELWTADRELLRQLGSRRPAYIRELGA
ncbi:MAG: type II toxin-antitoxin system VapC family toxin [Chloroflexota bacterium]